MQLGPTELIIIFAIILLLFGVGRVSRVGGELGKAVSNFRRGLSDGQPTTTTTTTDDQRDTTPRA